jgi:predicted permease
MADAVFSYVASAGMAMLQMALFCLVGIAFGIFPRAAPLLTNDTLKQMSNQIYWLFTPALLLSTFGAKLSMQLLRDSAAVIAWSIIHPVVNFLVGGLLVARIVKPERHFKITFQLAATFVNGASVPLLVMAGLCKSPQLINDTTAYERAVVMVFLYVLLWNLLFWSAGNMLMENDVQKQKLETASSASSTVATQETAGQVSQDSGDGHETKATHERAVSIIPSPPVVAPTSPVVPKRTDWRTLVWNIVRKAVLTPPVLGIVVGIVIGLWDPLRYVLFASDGALFSVGQVITLLGQPSIPISNIVLGGSLFQGLADLYYRWKDFRLHHPFSFHPQHDAPAPPAVNASEPAAVLVTPTPAPVPSEPLSIHVATPPPGDDTYGFEEFAMSPVDAHVHEEISTAISRRSTMRRSMRRSRGPSIIEHRPTRAHSLVEELSEDPFAHRTGDLSHEDEDSQETDARATGKPVEPPLSLRTGIALILARLVVCPAILFLLMMAAEGMRLPLIGGDPATTDPVLRLLILVESCVPAGQSVLLLCQMNGNIRAAKDLSIVYVIMYPLSLISMTVALSIAMSIVFG